MKTMSRPPEYPGQPWINPALVSIARAARTQRREPGELIARFQVEGEAVPWRSPTQGKGRTFTPKNAREWKRTVALAAHHSRLGEGAGRAAYPFAVAVTFWFTRKCPKGRKPGEVWETTPDFDNLTKNLTDAVAGNVFKTSRPKLDDHGRPVIGEDGKPGRISARFCAPQPTGRIIEDDKRVVEAHVYKVYWHTALANVEVRSAAPTQPGPFPFQ
jgi:Holliday junction resolvase RusA-like endonuclease